MHHPLIAPSPHGRAKPWTAALVTAAALSLAACGGDDDIQAVAPAPSPTPAPAPTGTTGTQAVPSTAAIVAAQAGIDGATASIALPTSGTVSDATIAAQQAALDGDTTSGSSRINANQAAMDANGVPPYKSL